MRAAYPARRAECVKKIPPMGQILSDRRPKTVINYQIVGPNGQIKDKIYDFIIIFDGRPS